MALTDDNSNLGMVLPVQPMGNGGNGGFGFGDGNGFWFLILFFLLSFSVLLEVFTAAYRQSMESERISRAMLEAQDLADRLYAAEDTETLLSSLGFTHTGGQWILEQDEMTLTAETDTERYGSGMFCRQAVRASDPQGNVIVELYDYSPEHMLEGIGESVSWVAGVLRE